MAITAIPNQSIAFQASKDINRPGEHTFRQLVNQADVLAVQVALSPYNGTNRVESGDFSASTGWTFGSGWSYDATNDEADASAATGSLDGTGPGGAAITVPNYYFRSKFTIKNYVTGTLSVSLEPAGTTLITSAFNNRTYEYYFPETGNNSTIEFAAATFTGSIDDVSVVTMSTIGLRIVNEAGSIVWSDYTNSNGYVTYLNDTDTDPDLLDPYPSVPKAKIQFTWSALALSNGCYRLEIVDTGEVLEDGTATSALVSVLQSQYFMVETSHDDTIMLSWTNDKNFNVGNSVVIDYDNFTFTQYMRVHAMLGNMVAEKTKTLYMYGNGQMRIASAMNLERRTLQLDNLPDYCHESLMTAVDHDKFYVDGSRYFSDAEEYTPTWRRKSNLAPVTIELLRQYGQQSNNNCSPENNPEYAIVIDGSLQTTVNAGSSYVCDRFLKVYFGAAESDVTFTADADTFGVYTSATQDGSSGTISYEIDTGSGFGSVTLPFTLNIGDDLKVSRTTFTSDGFVRIST